MILSPPNICLDRIKCGSLVGVTVDLASRPTRHSPAMDEFLEYVSNHDSITNDEMKGSPYGSTNRHIQRSR